MTNTVVNEWTVMIETQNTVITNGTVRGTRWANYTTSSAKFVVSFNKIRSQIYQAIDRIGELEGASVSTQVHFLGRLNRLKGNSQRLPNLVLNPKQYLNLLPRNDTRIHESTC